MDNLRIIFPNPQCDAFWVAIWVTDVTPQTHPSSCFWGFPKNHAPETVNPMLFAKLCKAIFPIWQRSGLTIWGLHFLSLPTNHCYEFPCCWRMEWSGPSILTAARGMWNNTKDWLHSTVWMEFAPSVVWTNWRHLCPHVYCVMGASLRAFGIQIRLRCDFCGWCSWVPIWKVHRENFKPFATSSGGFKGVWWWFAGSF